MSLFAFFIFGCAILGLLTRHSKPLYRYLMILVISLGLTFLFFFTSLA